VTLPKVRRCHCFEVRADGSFVKPLLREHFFRDTEIDEGELSKHLFGSLEVKRTWLERVSDYINT
jgi:hypothetical protein